MRHQDLRELTKRSLSDIGVRHETKEATADARPQGAEKPEAYSPEYVEDFSEPRTKQMLMHRSPQ
jgi:hypothetical protein